MGQFMEGIIEDVKKTSRDVVSLLGDRFEDDEEEEEEEDPDAEEDANPRLVAAQQQQEELELTADSTVEDSSLGELTGDVRRFGLAR